MIYVLDTHPIIWFVEADPRLSTTVKAAMQEPLAEFVVPTIALVEIQFLRAKRRITSDLASVYRDFIGAANCKVHPLDEQVVSLIPTGLNIHDSIIVATALVYRDLFEQPVTLITKDREIGRSGLIQTLW
jgi:PIN domain nuclease of toxin-antitoxin system